MTTPPKQSHNNFVQKMLSDPYHLLEILLAYLPASVTQGLEASGIEILSNAFINENLRKSIADAVLRFKHPRQYNRYVYCVIEIKSRPDKLVSAQLMLTLSVLY